MSTRISVPEGRRTSPTRSVGLAALAMVVTVLLIGGLAATARAATHAASQRVALIPQAGPVPPQGPNGIMPTSSFVSGRPSESFSRFSFHNLPWNQVTAGNLANYDTIALIQVSTYGLTASEKAAIAGFVANGGKLIIHDADETKANDYSWLLPNGHYVTRVGEGCNNCGSSSGSATIGTSNALISADPLDPSYVNLGELYEFTDQGDANLLVSDDPRWFNLAQGTNGRRESGSAMAYAEHNGLIIYNGFDTDFIKPSAAAPWRCNEFDLQFACPPPPAPHPTVDWLAQMWYSELALGWGASSGGGGNSAALPTGTPLFQVGTPVSPAASGLSAANTGSGRCRAHREVVLHLRALLDMRHRTIVRLDVYLNGRHVLSEMRPFTTETLNVPRRGKVTVMVVATTKRGYHLVAKRRYHGC